MKPLWLLVKRTFQKYGRDNCSQMAAAISYYVLFSIIPLTIVLVVHLRHARARDATFARTSSTASSKRRRSTRARTRSSSKTRSATSATSAARSAIIGLASDALVRLVHVRRNS